MICLEQRDVQRQPPFSDRSGWLSEFGYGAEAPQIRQAQTLRSSGFQQVVVLIEGPLRSAGNPNFHLDGATLTQESKILEYMFEEQLNGLKQ